MRPLPSTLSIFQAPNRSLVSRFNHRRQPRLAHGPELRLAWERQRQELEEPAEVRP
jgi:hypothetical protein